MYFNKATCFYKNNFFYNNYTYYTRWAILIDPPKYLCR